MNPKELRLRPISAVAARAAVIRWHYSRTIPNNQAIRFGVFDGRGAIRGVVTFGPPMDKRRVIGIVSGTKWDGMVEIGRMALDPLLPKNSESRCLAVALRILRKAYPSLEWVLTFADACQCGDGTIYRALGALLTGVRRNTGIAVMPSGQVVVRKTLDNTYGGFRAAKVGGASVMEGHQIRYVIPLVAGIAARLTVQVLPYTVIAERGASMYMGRRRASEASGMQPRPNGGEGGSTPTLTLQQSTARCENEHDGTPFPAEERDAPDAAPS